MRISILLLVCIAILSACQPTVKKTETAQAERWSVEKAQEWSAKNEWIRGCNFQPSTAINQLEMFQAETFDTATINRELGWAENLGMNTMRVYLHHVAWQVDNEGFKNRLNSYLTISSNHGIKTIFVFFDDCWNATYEAGTQPDPKPGVHNSGWVRDPGDLIFEDSTLMHTLETYVKDVLSTFKDDKRILLWDLYNEPGNSNQKNKSMPLLKNVFQWAREINPSQPVSSGIWNKGLVKLNAFQLAHSDIITYHNYNDASMHSAAIDSLKKYGRPLVCTEYMARKNKSTFRDIMPLLKENNIGAINWGFVAGKTNTIFAWGTPLPDVKEPELWFHDIFRTDGTPFSQDEVDFIKLLTLK